MAPMMNMQKAKMMAISLSLTFVVIHCFLFFFFYYYKVTPMMYFNIFSVAFYIFLFGISLRGFLSFFSIAVYLEVLLHMTAATYFTGWECGFQTTLIGMCVLISYAEYLGRALKIKTVSAVPMCLLGMILYLGLCRVTHYHPPAYSLPPVVSYRMQMFWGFTVFVIITVFLAVFVHITVRSEEYLARQAGHDRLTGLPNRHFIMDHLEAVKKSNDLHDHWICILDIDDFKLINDSYGHNCGDSILVQIAEILQRNTDEYTACRWGGEEFILIGRINEDPEACLKKIEDLRIRIMDSRFIYRDIEIRLTVTGGYEEYQDGMTIDEWVDAADRKLYAGKKNGKNQLVS